MPAIRQLPTPAPARTMPDTEYVPAADALMGALHGLVADINAAVTAMNNNSTNSTSTTSLAIGTGSKSLTVEINKSYVPGQSLRIASTASPSNWMAGDVTSYNPSTGDLVVAVSWGNGSGTLAAWTVSLSPIFLGGNAFGLFYKADATTVAFTKTAAATLSVKAGTHCNVGGTLVSFAAATAIAMPTLTAGTDYAIYACADGTIRADANFSAPSGYTTANARKIGGFHYAPGGNATGVAGGDTTPAINAYSFWDLKFKPECPDPRGMALVADGFWADIYLLGLAWLTNGTSAYNVTIADGSNPPKIPTKFGGNGTTAYGSLTWREAAEVMRANGKRLPTYSEFAALAYGTTEAASATAATDPVSTILRAESTSKWGVMLSTGNLYVWGDEFAGPYGTAAWTANTGGRGSTYNLPNAVLFGGAWNDGAASGSRCSLWNSAPAYSDNSVGARGVCDHLILD